MQIENFKNKINKLSSKGIPFLFLIDFEMKKPQVFTLDEAKRHKVFYNIKGFSNYFQKSNNQTISKLEIFPVSKNRYKKAFEIVTKNINFGNSYLLNLTFPTGISTNNTLEDIFVAAKASYKLLYKDQLTVFSPECFIKIKDNLVYSYPMKGTIDASIPNAENIILEDEKELREHYTIVDLIRNDLSMISKNVTVTKFRYIEKIKTNNKELLQVSSEIRGKLPEDWKNNLGDLLIKLLPAGSVSGAPKKKTVEIIRKAEKQNRGYYTGIFGIFDGKDLDSAVNIRFIENKNNGLRYRSGGGITSMSDPDSEYNEMLNKIYVPIS
ncbi:MAG TPA: aminodeoxychorismate synthase component I [Bacteroidetes bacterium]|nr:aminodeoxychorismate synthase component I [Bacteroidota bacterium]